MDNESNMWKMLGAMLVEAALDKCDAALPALLQERFGVKGEQVELFATTAYSLTISLPYAFLKLTGLFDMTLTLLRSPGEGITAGELADKLKHGFASLSPTFGAAITPNLVADIARITVMDWLTEDKFPSETQMKSDHQMWFHLVMEYRGAAPDRDQMNNEFEAAIDSLTAVELLLMPPDLRAKIEAIRQERRGKQ